MKKARTKSKLAANSGRTAGQKAAPADDAPQPAPPRPRRGLGTLGKQSLAQPTVIPALFLIPAKPAPPQKLPAPPQAEGRGDEKPASGRDPDQAGLARYLRDELKSLLTLFDEPPP